jgi:hypothetical protein
LRSTWPSAEWGKTRDLSLTTRFQALPVSKPCPFPSLARFQAFDPARGHT